MAKTTLTVDVEYDDRLTNPKSLATAADRPSRYGPIYAGHHRRIRRSAIRRIPRTFPKGQVRAGLPKVGRFAVSRPPH